MRLRIPLVLGCAIAAGFALAGGSDAARPPLPAVKHVFVIVLENENADETFGPDTAAPYLARTLTAQGAFIPGYYGVTHQSLGNYLALISGQGANLQTQADCPLYTDFVATGIRADGQALGQGCVYPEAVSTVAGQLEARGLTWKGYLEDLGNDPARESATCGHPAPNAPDPTQQAEAQDQYAARHNPFVYFHSIVDSPSCSANDVPLDRLPGDLQRAGRTANLTFITPNLCHDGHDSPCKSGEPGGLTSADAWLRTWVPRILASPAYKHDGLLLITFDEAESQGASADASACCDEQQFPNTPNNGGPTAGRGGGRVGAVLLSRFIRPGTVSAQAYNHYSTLRTIETLFDLPYLGYASEPGAGMFGGDVFTRS
jgi:phosphatidylinositol-3-phosphatase